FLQTEMSVSKIRFPETSSIGIKPISQEGSERLIRSAIEYALANNLTKVTLVHKGNIQKFTEGGFRSWGYDLAKREYADELASGKLVINDIIADNFLQQILLNPEKFDVVALTNLNGDYASDALAAQVGGIGISPGANINYLTGHAIFEATHGTAPDIAGKDIANPCSVLLSACMLFDYIGWTEVASLITAAIEKTFAQGQFTADLAQGKVACSTSEFAAKLIENL
ncbi:MAG: isocitrate/isopropylmalate family dehydrogenase, partial [Streptococcus gallolyticus]|nr:isocitrate/isopropylmalate family dehydrogenase [Streptococcus gallolyticus]